MENNLRIVLAVSSYPSAIYFKERLCNEKNVVGIICEKRRGKRETVLRLMKRARKVGILNVVDQVLFRLLFRLTERRKSSISVTETEKTETIPQCYVKTVNDKEAKKFIQDLNADVLVVYGVSILKNETISLPRKGVLNIHPGITPEYRGLDPLFWAIVNKDFGNIGATIHFIDEGIDTGPIAAQDTVDASKDDSYTALFDKVMKKGTDLMVDVLTKMENGGVGIIKKPGSVSRLYTRPGITNYSAYRRGLKSMALLK